MIDIKGNWEKIMEDTQPFNSAATTLFYLHLVLHCPPGEFVRINSREIGDTIGITNPYNHLRRIVDQGLGERINEGHHGTQFKLLKEYR